MLRPLFPSQKETLTQAALAFHAALPGGQAEQYLRDRGIDPDSEEATGFRLGEVPADYPGFERFAGRLAIPNLNANGGVVGLKFRALGEESPKYDQPDGQVGRLYNLRALPLADDWIALTEGELDTVSLGILGIPALGVPGVNGWKAHHPLLLEGFRRIVLVRDADEAGGLLVATLMKSSLDVAVVRPPHGFKDVNEALAAGEGEEMRHIITEAAR